jgi:uncharacterized protein YbaR (Trm112 family)
MGVTSLRRRPTDEELLQSVEDLARLPLIRGRMLVCPSCEKEHDILAYKPLEIVQKYADQVVPPIICPSCKHWFALRA